MSLSRVIRWTMAVSVALLLAAFVARVALPMMLFTVPGQGIFATLLAVVIFCGCALSCSAMVERGRLVLLMWIGVGASGVALGSWAMLSFLGNELPGLAAEEWARLTTLPSGLAIWCALVGVLWRQRRVGAVAAWTRRVAIAGDGALIIVMVGVFLVGEPMDFHAREFTFRLMGVTALIGGSATIGALILLRARELETAGGAGGAGDASGPRLGFEAVCPRCAERQAMTTGGGACSRCGLKISVTVP